MCVCVEVFRSGTNSKEIALDSCQLRSSVSLVVNYSPVFHRVYIFQAGGTTERKQNFTLESYTGWLMLCHTYNLRRAATT